MRSQNWQLAQKNHNIWLERNSKYRLTFILIKFSSLILIPQKLTFMEPTFYKKGKKKMGKIVGSLKVAKKDKSL